MNEDLLRLRADFDAFMTDLNWARSPQSLYAPMEYILGLGGKRFRPLLTLLSADAFGGINERAKYAASAIEVFHNFSLIHDDIMDEADMRRGHDSVHKKFGLNSGILSGDAMLILSLQLLSKASKSDDRNEISEKFMDCAMHVCEGQQMDMDLETVDEPEREVYLEMIRKKTAILPAEGMRIGALVNGAGPEASDMIYTFGENLGMAFQMQDDLLDVYGDESLVGKVNGGDILQNKKTILFIEALSALQEDERLELKRLYDSKEKSEDKISKVKALYDRAGVCNTVKSLKMKYHEDSLAALESIAVSADKKVKLQSVANDLLNRLS